MSATHAAIITPIAIIAKAKLRPGPSPTSTATNVDPTSRSPTSGTNTRLVFPATMAWRRRESMLAELRGGWRYTWGNPAFRAMLVFFAVLNLFVSPLFLMVTPLVLDFATLADVGRVAFAGGVGVVAGGLLMAVWGGPRRRRMTGMLLSTSVLAACCLLTELWSDLGWVTVGSFGMSMSLTVLNGIYATIIQLKVPQRFHGRVISLNTLVAWSTLPIGFGVIAPYGTALLDGRIGLMYLVCAAGIVAVVVGALRIPALRRVDTEMPDARARRPRRPRRRPGPAHDHDPIRDGRHNGMTAPGRSPHAARMSSLFR